MPREDISFKTADQTTLRGWLYKPPNPISGPLPCLVIAHGFSAVKDMILPRFAEHFATNLPMACLVYDHRGFGDSDNQASQPRQEIIPAHQISDYSDAITYLQRRSDINPDRIGIWGTSYSGGHVLCVGAIDRRVKAVVSQVPFVDGWENFHRLIRPDFVPLVNKLIQEDRLAVAAGEAPKCLPVVNENPLAQSALPSPDSYQFFTTYGRGTKWENSVTVKSLEALRGYIPATYVEHISPIPLLMVVAENDQATPPDLALKAYAKALEPKSLHILRGGHFDAYDGSHFEESIKVQTAFLRRRLCY
ncbi:Alpha/Beta hydrolase protein [Aspergillus bertholletiae]|uniref:Alpha/Beta hydrolase protein n=1 Tax=Aspergillus bertholletiae TaxID=1226010 RepID=A0A5N7APU5_9EURO|nr:Alpha/Beta hydrolase protein [Aspergillus bertholletiae]